MSPLRMKMAAMSVIGSFLLCFSAQAGWMDQVVETRLDNGLKVLLLENHKAPVVSFQVWYRTGARHDPFGKTGLAHLFEHLMFKGTPRVSGDAFTRKIQENGGNFNAFTSHDYAAYFETLAADRIQIAMELEADRMANLQFTREQFQTERSVVMEERRLRTQDQPKALLWEQVAATAFQTQPYQRPIIGWMDDLARITYKDVQHYHRGYYIPSNAFLVVVGDFDAKLLLPRIREIFGPIPQGESPSHHRYQDPPQLGERRVTLRKESQLPFLVMGYHVPNQADPDSYVLEVIAALLSSGKSSRLEEHLVRSKRLVISAGADHSLLNIDPSLFEITAEPLPGKTISQVREALDEEVARLQREPVGERELQKAKNQLESSFVYGQDSLFYQALLLARHEIVGGWEKIKAYVPQTGAVTPADIQRVANRYLVPTNRTVGILRPGTAEPGGKASTGVDQ